MNAAAGGWVIAVAPEAGRTVQAGIKSGTGGRSVGIEDPIRFAVVVEVAYLRKFENAGRIRHVPRLQSELAGRRCGQEEDQIYQSIIVSRNSRNVVPSVVVEVRHCGCGR